jgi:hypothetical protein
MQPTQNHFFGIRCICITTGFSCFFKKRKGPTLKKRTFINVLFFGASLFLFQKNNKEGMWEVGTLCCFVGPTDHRIF